MNAVPAPRNVTPQYREFKSEAGGFAVLTPVVLKERIESRTTRLGEAVTHVFVGTLAKTSYAVSYSETPHFRVQHADPQELLDRSRDAAVGNLNGKLVFETLISLNGFPGRELVINAQARTGEDVTMKTRIFLVKERLYGVIVIAVKGEMSGAEMSDFLKSFQLLPK